jgi:hypothetical protein
MLRSGLALAGANRWLAGLPVPTDAEDGILTAMEVTGLDLQGSERRSTRLILSLSRVSDLAREMNTNSFHMGQERSATLSHVDTNSGGHSPLIQRPAITFAIRAQTLGAH